nr:hypothetical protein [Tanacetum cinerariifolium]
MTFWSFNIYLVLLIHEVARPEPNISLRANLGVLQKGCCLSSDTVIDSKKKEAGIQLQAEEFDLMAAAADLDEIEEVNANCILMANLQQASKSGTQTDKAPVYDPDGSAETLNEEISDLNKQLSKEKSTVFFLLDEMKKLKSDFKIHEDELFDKQIQLEKKKKELDNILVKT